MCPRDGLVRKATALDLGLERKMRRRVQAIATLQDTFQMR